MAKKRCQAREHSHNHPLKWVRCYQQLREDILNGRFAPGQRLIERRLCEKYAVSRPSLRAAMHHLGAEGLVEIRPGDGAYMASLALQDVSLILDIREALEGMASRLAALKAKAEQLDLMEDEVTMIRESFETREYRKYARHTRRFHNLVIEAAQNSYLSAVLYAARVRTVHFSSDFLLHNRVGEMCEHHAQIFQAIKARDADLAEKYARMHIRVLKEVVSDLELSPVSEDGQ